MVTCMSRREVIPRGTPRDGAAANRPEALRQQRSEHLPPLGKQMPL